MHPLVSWLFALLLAVPNPDPIPTGTVVLRHFDSEILKDTKTGVDPRRSISIYLPPGYEESDNEYPVIYFLHNIMWDNERMFEDGVVQATFDRAIARGAIEPFILVAPSYTTPTVGSLYGNGATAGRWFDYTLQEVLPFVESNYRIRPGKENRGIAGEFLGGYGAFKLAMMHPDTFNAVYALHPVATGTGLIPMKDRPDWQLIHDAESFADLESNVFSQVFTAMSQEFLPNPNRPPFYCDFIVERPDGELVQNYANTTTLQSRFLLDRQVANYAENLRSLAGIKFDWGRYDTNQDHIFSNHTFTRLLDELGIPHEAEEYTGGPFDRNWIEHGRVEHDMLPFFARHLSATPQSPAIPAPEQQSTVLLHHIDSEVLQNTKTDLDPRRSVSIYLPPGYDTSETAYPVVYFLHGLFWDSERMFEDGVVQATLDAAIADNTIEPFILVAPNYSTPTVGSFFENSSTSGRWLDFTTQELIPYIDNTFRTLPTKESRGITGELMGGYGALKLAMRHPDLFGSVYALHPVGTGVGAIPVSSLADYQKIHSAESFDDLDDHVPSQIFTAMAQAFLPNPDRPPFYADFMAEPEGDAYLQHLENRITLLSRFLLDRQIEAHADNLRSLRAIKFDWGRYDTYQSHVYSNQNFTRKLDDLLIPHEAEEYTGGAFDQNWAPYGRVQTKMLPFFSRYLEFRD